MADKEQSPSSSSVETQTFTAGMVKDLTDSFSKKGTWSHARNAANNSHDGELGALGNEPANKLLVLVTYPIINVTYIADEKWVVFSTDNINSEIGIFDEARNTYTKTINQECLGFKKYNLLSVEVKKNFDCTYSVYWTDPGNVDRVMNLSRPPYLKSTENNSIDNCDVIYTNQVDCAKLAMSRVIKSPKIRLKKGTGAGTLLNGTYQCVIAYTLNGIRVTDYFSPSNAQSVFSHSNMSGSLELIIDEIDTDFEEFELGIISNINLQATAKKLGIYSTYQNTVMIDYIDQTTSTIDIESIINRGVIYDKSDSLVSVNNYLLRIGVRTKPDFNYQPQANLISTSWVAVELPADYYQKGGNLTSYMRDEQQPFTIRWVYESGQRSADYPIIGRAATRLDIQNATGDDVYEMFEEIPVIKQNWEVHNTASITSIEQYDLSEGRVIAEGKMGYWESTERYPQKPTVWGDLCGKPIRHSKMPDNVLVPHMSANGTKIVILSVKFSGITHPLDMDGNPIADIVGYEFMKASREGNKTIIAKGILNNVGEYDIPNGITDKKGLYTNYPFNDLRTDPFLSKDIVKGGCSGAGYKPMGTFRKDVFSFHSPDTQFRNPFLSSSELKVYGEMIGEVTGGYEKVFKHPRHKLIRDFALIVSGLVGVGEGLLAVKGKKTTSYESARNINIGMIGVSSTFSAGVATGTNAASVALDAALSTIGAADPTGVTDSIKQQIQFAKDNIAGIAPGTIGGSKTTTTTGTAISQLPLPLRILEGAILFSFYFAQGTEQTLRIIRSLVPFQQYALQYNAHGFYTDIKETQVGNTRRKITDASYLEPHLQEFTGKYRVNNLFRGRQVILELGKNLSNPVSIDNTRQSIGDKGIWKDPLRKFTTNTSAFYGALKIPIKNQFGQIDSMILLPISVGVEKTLAQKITKFNSPVIFGGDIYINRYTEKNTFFYFNDWMYNLVDGTEWNYNNNYNIPNPRYWINTNEYDVSQLTSAIVKLNFKEDALPNDLAHLDRESGDCKSKISFIIKDGYFYLFSNGVRDFFVESEINLAQRDWDDLDSQRHYDANSYTDLSSLFRSSIIKSGNNFKYDYSLSVSKLLLNNASWGSVLARDYDPYNQLCFTYYPNRIIYSLQQQDELKKDNWLVYLANNYKDFHSKVTTVQSINETGALILFQNESPLMFRGVDQLQTEGGIKITIGDGGLFNQNTQSISNANKAYEYGSCQNVRAVESTPSGIFWISVNQGKIFTYGDGMIDITTGLKWWFAQYLPFFLLKDFPDFELKDNSLVGISAETIYDNTNNMLYFVKRDYELKSQYRSQVTYKGKNNFNWNGNPFVLGDSHYFVDSSFTISYDTKEKVWISYHDWKPDFLLPSKTHFLSVKENAIWKHNECCDLYCNYYGIDYPFEIEYNQPTGQEINTVRSLEYQLECFKYYNDCRDAHNIQFENFDRMIVSNIEQISGLIKLSHRPKNSPMSVIRSAQVDGEGTNMFFTKVENKYRIDNITDLTRDRGEVSGLERQIWITEANGYVRTINPVNINYTKSILQRKKMRHYNNKIFLRKNICGSSKFLLKIINTKLLKSER